MFADLLLCVCIIAHIVLAPYTKVEESFNMQAMHDLLYTEKIEEYDHLEFSGVVPRSFFGPHLIVGLVRPWVRLFEGLGMMTSSKAGAALMVRVCMGAVFIMTFRYLRSAFVRKFREPKLSNIISILCCCQFHLLFYCSRPLANTFATFTINLALSYFVVSTIRFDQQTSSSSSSNRSLSSKEKYEMYEHEVQRTSAAGWSIVWFAVTCIFFRCDMILLAGCVIVTSFIGGWLDLKTFFKYGFLTSVVSIGVSVVVDSYYWRRLVWPEFEVLWFNTFSPDSNGELFTRSSAWGVEPWSWYFMKALPKSLLVTLVLIPIAFIGGGKVPTSWSELFGPSQRSWSLDRSILSLFVPCFSFIFLYSFLPHKELRFIYPILPFLNCIAGVGYQRLVQASETIRLRRLKHEKEEGSSTSSSSSSRASTADTTTSPASSSFAILFGLVYRMIQFGLIVSIGIASVSLYVSSWNYPGGEAFHKFHQLIDCDPTTSTTSSQPLPLLHISNLAATTGVTRFGEVSKCVRYSKLEGIKVEQLQQHPFEYILTEVENVPGFEVVSRDGEDGIIRGFSQLRFTPRRLPFIFEVELKPMIWIMKRTTPYVQPVATTTTKTAPDEVEVDIE